MPSSMSNLYYMRPASFCYLRRKQNRKGIHSPFLFCTLIGQRYQNGVDNSSSARLRNAQGLGITRMSSVLPEIRATAEGRSELSRTGTIFRRCSTSNTVRGARDRAKRDRLQALAHVGSAQGVQPESGTVRADNDRTELAVHFWTVRSK